MWYVLQCLIVGSVVLHNHYYEWTPNKILPALIGFGLAYLVTQALWRLKTRSE